MPEVKITPKKPVEPKPPFSLPEVIKKFFTIDKKPKHKLPRGILNEGQRKQLEELGYLD